MELQESESNGCFSVHPKGGFGAENLQDSKKQSQPDIPAAQGGGYLIRTNTAESRKRENISLPMGKGLSLCPGRKNAASESHASKRERRLVYGPA